MASFWASSMQSLAEQFLARFFEIWPFPPLRLQKLRVFPQKIPMRQLLWWNMALGERGTQNSLELGPKRGGFNFGGAKGAKFRLELSSRCRWLGFFFFLFLIHDFKTLYFFLFGHLHPRYLTFFPPSHPTPQKVLYLSSGDHFVPMRDREGEVYIWTSGIFNAF